ncbi:MAG: acyl-CoA dehydrogenase family protein [Paraburkholderia fungorum]|nr:acyl-CoA dehydrogenase family protein [Paraburkholderia fungorum]
MDLDFCPEDEAFRVEVRAWLRENAPANAGVEIGLPSHLETQSAWERKLGAKGWLAYQWPKEHGGPGWTATQRYIFDTERALAGAPVGSPFGLAMLGPVLMHYGTAEQKAKYLPPIARGEVFWCQGYSEPGSGSDLASLKTLAERDGEHYVVNGQKIWTTQGHWAHHIFCLCRTNKDVPKQQGISFLLIDMDSPGIEVRSIMTIDGHHHLNEVFFTNVRVPAENLVGKEGEGWTIAKYLLTHERTAIAGVADSMYQLRRTRDAVDTEASLSSDPRVHRRLAELEVDLIALEYTNLRTLDRLAQGKPPGSESSGLKIKGAELQQAISEAQVELGGLSAVPWLTGKGEGHEVFRSATQRYNFLRASSIYGGTNEIQKNVLAKLLLGMG